MTYNAKNRRRGALKSKARTLDQKHTEKLESFSKSNSSLPARREKIAKMKRELSKLSSINPTECSIEDVRKKSHLLDTIQDLESEIRSIENCTASLDYIVATFPILVNYYDNKYVVDDGEEDLVNDTPLSNKKNILSYFIEESPDFIVKAQEEEMKPTSLVKKKSRTADDSHSHSGSKTSMKNNGKMGKSSSKLSSRGSSKVEAKSLKASKAPKALKPPKVPQQPVSRARLYEDYLSITDSTYKSKRRGKSSTCSLGNCGGEKKYSQIDGCLVCTKCGLSEIVLISTEKPNYKEPTQDSGTYAYKRINHLTEILSQLQAKESTDIPPEVIANILREIKKRKIDKNELDIFKLRRILKILGYIKHYEHVPHLLQIINGKEPPNFSRRDEMKIKKMFKDIQKPFALYCPKDRKNFLNYSYVLHKFCELLDLDEYISYFSLLKNNSKLRQHDKIWKKICEYMRWKYYKSI